MKKYRQGIHDSEVDKAMIWDRWQQGETLHSIARLLDRYHPSIRRCLAETGGIRPWAPSVVILFALGWFQR